MALVGRLEDLGLTELFHLLSLHQKSGKLTINEGDKTGVFLFRKGKLVHATNGRGRKPLGDILVERGWIAQSSLDRALEIQRQGTIRRKVGTILIELGAIRSEQIEQVIGEQLREITENYLRCDTGFFNFRPSEEGNENADQSHTGDFSLESGVNSDRFILELLTKLDEVEGNRVKDPRQAVQPLSDPSLKALTPDGHSDEDLQRLLDYMVDPKTYSDISDQESRIPAGAEDIAGLHSLMVEIQLRAPSFTGEITLMILRFATRVVNRGVLWRIAPDGISGIGQFGIEKHGDFSIDHRIRNMSIPCHEPSVFFEVIENLDTYRGRLKPSVWNDYLTKNLGGGWPNEVVAIPIVVDGMIVAVFLGDNLPDDRPIGSIQGLEILMIEAGLALERKLLTAKLSQAEERIRMLEEEIAKNDHIT